LKTLRLFRSGADLCRLFKCARTIKGQGNALNTGHTIFEISSDDESHERVTENPEQIKTLLETGFEYLCQKDNKVLLRKRK
jgi:hypothetical protein